jgi:NitT/TauT family transport system ATP-binding protein/nitrate/nitrite transport system substrate-binding protein
VTGVDLGFIALADAAPLIVAQAHGHFESEGLHVALHREVSWATIRDKVSAGLHQGAHMLAPLALTTRLGISSEPADLIVPLALNAHGAAIGVSASLARALADTGVGDRAAALALVCAARRAAKRAPPTFAVVFPYSIHNYMLRYWAAHAGLDPDRDLRIVVAAPTAIAQRLHSGEIDGFAVGAPWADVSVAESGGEIVLESGAFWPDGPDKVLALSQNWAEREPEAASALARATLRAALWCDAPENVLALSNMLAECLGAPATTIARRLGQSDSAGLRFARAAFPSKSHAAWLLSQMLRWGQIDRRVDLSRALDAYRPDLYRAAADALGITSPSADSQIETQFMDGARFDPAGITGFAAHFAITRASGA